MNLGRGGFDYIVVVIVVVFDVDSLEIWMDVDGFMIVDLCVISMVYIISELIYVEVIEFCNFGVKVVYLFIIYLVCYKNILILIKNIFNLDVQGMVIK